MEFEVFFGVIDEVVFGWRFCLYSLFIRFCLSVGEVWFLVAFLGDWQFYEESSAFSLLAFKGYYAFLCFH